MAEQTKTKQIMTNNIGLLHGVTGLCLSSFLMGETEKGYDYLHDIQDYLKAHELGISFDNGINGISWALMFLMKKNLIDYDFQLFFKSVDCLNYREYAYDHDSFHNKEAVADIFSMVYSLDTVKRSNEEKSIIIKLINKSLFKLLKLLNEDDFIEPARFSLDYFTPRLLLLIHYVSTIHEISDYLPNILDEIKRAVIFRIPISHGNRLFLSFAISNRLFQKDKEWNEFASVLLENIRIKQIYDEVNNNPYINDGYGGIYLLIRKHTFFKSMIKDIGEYILEKINTSYEIRHLEINSIYKQHHMGLYDGIAGIELIKYLINEDKKWKR